VFEFICDRIIPGCTHRESDDAREAVRERAPAHLHAHHGSDYLHKSLEDELDLAIATLRR
jgi:predicted small metal-binding protein